MPPPTLHPGGSWCRTSVAALATTPATRGQHAASGTTSSLTAPDGSGAGTKAA
jgi:hypothetical protein